MNAQRLDALTDGLEAAVRGTPGVTTLYPAVPLVRATVSNLVAHRSGLIGLEQRGDTVAVTISIGIRLVPGAADTARAVADAASRFLAAQGHPHSEVSITVAHVSERAESAKYRGQALRGSVAEPFPGAG